MAGTRKTSYAASTRLKDFQSGGTRGICIDANPVVHGPQEAQPCNKSPRPQLVNPGATCDAGDDDEDDSSAAGIIINAAGKHDVAVLRSWPKCSKCYLDEDAHVILRARMRLADGTWDDFKNWPFCLVCFASALLDVQGGFIEPDSPDVDPILYLGSPTP